MITNDSVKNTDTGEPSPDVAIERYRIGPLQRWVAGLCMAALMVEGMDLQLLALAAPKIVGEWAITVRQLAPALTAALVGMIAGNALGGSLGDRFGKRPILLGSILCFGMATIAAASAQNAVQLGIIRLVCGIGFGAAIPNAMALTSEWVPMRKRAQAIGILGIGTPAGGMVGALVIGPVLTHYGWRAGFAFSGGLTLVLATIAAARLPESPAYMLGRGRDAAVRELLGRAFWNVEPVATNGGVPPSSSIKSGVAGRYLSRPNRRVNIGLAFAFFANLYACYALINWLPTAATSAGETFARAVQASFCYNLASIAGAFLAAKMIVGLGSKRTGLLVIAASVAAVVVLALSLGVFHDGSTILLASASAAGLGMGATQAALYTLSAHAYPLAYRATGIGIATAAGRIGGIAATIAGGLTLAQGQLGLMTFFAGVVLALGLAMAGLVLVDRHIAPRLSRQLQ